MTRRIALLAAVLGLAVPAAAPASQSDLSAALAQERYYMGYDEPGPAHAAPATAPATAPTVPADDDMPWKALAIGSGGLVLVLLGTELVTLARLRRAT
jgi:hypothetical protein